mmetsp:Transcript_92769/g.278320  ORF Transcript_92769/g.278320 Transcript_92769/m.278320 type:complete len:255 (-) Transcript_92769:385-1149(-)
MDQGPLRAALHVAGDRFEPARAHSRAQHPPRAPGDGRRCCGRLDGAAGGQPRVTCTGGFRAAAPAPLQLCAADGGLRGRAHARAPLGHAMGGAPRPAAARLPLAPLLLWRHHRPCRDGRRRHTLGRRPDRAALPNERPVRPRPHLLLLRPDAACRRLRLHSASQATHRRPRGAPPRPRLALRLLPPADGCPARRQPVRSHVVRHADRLRRVQLPRHQRSRDQRRLPQQESAVDQAAACLAPPEPVSAGLLGQRP